MSRPLVSPGQGWHRSARGNLTRALPRDWGQYRLTVYQRPRGSGLYGWSICNGEDVWFGDRVYGSEREAAEAVLREVTEA